MTGARILVSGMGGELGSLVAKHLEAESWVDAIVGLDLDPPRRRLRRSEFHLVDPHDRRRTAALVRATDPTIILHAGVYEPGARANSGGAAHRSADSASAIFGQVPALASLRGIVVRSGIEVYGRAPSSPSRPDESSPRDPTSTFGRILADVEQRAEIAGRAASVPVALVRLAPVIGPHVPSPLGRLLRLPVVPFDPFRSAEFGVVHLDDAAAALVAAARLAVDGAVNVIGSGTVTPWRAARIGGRPALPVVGPGWWPTRHAAHLLGAPMPDHVVELLTRGRRADWARAAALGLAPRRSTVDAVRALYAWESVTHLRPTPDAVPVRGPLAAVVPVRVEEPGIDTAATAATAVGRRGRLRVVAS